MSSGFLSRLKQQQMASRPTQQSLQLVYLLSIARQRCDRFEPIQLWLQLSVAERHANGLLEGIQPYHLQAQHLLQPPGFLTALDCELLTELKACEPSWEGAYQAAMPISLPENWMQRLLNTGRSYITSTITSTTTSTTTRTQQGMQLLHWGEPISAKPQWHRHLNGSQQLSWQLPEQCFPMQWQTPFYFNEAMPTIGRIESRLPIPANEWVQRSPKIQPEVIADFLATHTNDFDAWGLPLPVILPITEMHPKPKPILQLSGAQEAEVKMVLQFVYSANGCAWQVEHHATSATHSEYSSGEVVRFHRDTNTEQQLLDALLQQLTLPIQRQHAIRLQKAEDWRTFMLEQVPQLRTAGWTIEIAPDFYYYYVQVDHYSAHIRQRESHWFDLALGIDIGGEVYDLMPLLQQCAARYSLTELHRMDADATVEATLEDGRQVCLPAQRVAQWLSVLVELYDRDKKHNRLRLPANQLPRLAQLEAAADNELRWQDEHNLLSQAQEQTLWHDTRSPQLPASFRANLRSYQAQGVIWLQRLRANHCGGILADDMGLGKTVQTLAHIAIEQSQGRLVDPALVVMPTSLLSNWQQEAAQFAPMLKCAIIHGPLRHHHFDQLQQYHLLFTTYQLLVNDLERWQAQPLSLLILDEAQAIKNAGTLSAQAAKKITAEQKLCLSGTPLENHLGELWSLFDFIMPGFLDNESRFQRYYRSPIEKEGDHARAQALLTRVAPFMLRRRKDEVATELPPKTEVIVRVALHDAQRDLYETLRTQALGQLQEKLLQHGEAEGRVLILNALLQLRQLCCDPRLTRHPDAHNIPSAKRKHCLEMLEELVDEGRSILVFSQFTRMLDLLADDLETAGIPFLQLTGQSRHRGELVQRFQAGEAPVFLISLKAGGTGLNLTRADSVIHYDPWWNSAAEQQATDRAYRIGQDKPVFVYKLLAQNTIEEKILALQQHKRALLDAVYQAAEHTGEQVSLDNEALLALLQHQHDPNHPNDLR